mgnify:CR=1 FL=1
MRPLFSRASAKDPDDLRRPDGAGSAAADGQPACLRPGGPPAGKVSKASLSGLRAAAASLATAAVLLTAGSAHAIGEAAPLDINRFHPAPGNSKILTVDLAQVGPHLQIVPQLFLHYARRPLVYTLGSVPQADLVKNRLTTDVSISLALWRHLQIALALPVTLYQNGEVPDDGFLPPQQAGSHTLPTTIASIGQEDLRLLIKGVFYNSKPATAESATFGIGAIGDLTFPTGNADSYLGSKLPTFQLRLAAHITWRRLTAALNFGGTFGTNESLYNVHSGSGLVFGVGAQLELFRARTMPFYLLTEVFGFSAAEAAETLGLSVAAVNSALQRARAALAERTPEDVPAPAGAEQELVERYVSAFERYDTEALAALMQKEVVMSMPPYTLWLQGPDAVGTWMRGRGLGCRGSRLVRTRACGAPAFAQYRASGDGGHHAWALNTLELSAGRIARLTFFLDVETLFPAFGLPLRLLA